VEKKWSIGVNAFSWYQIVQGIVVGLIGVLSFDIHHIGYSIQRPIVAILLIVMGVYLLQRKNWARLGIITVLTAALAISLYFAILFRPNILVYFFRCMITGAMIYFLTRPKVKEQFK